MLKWILCFVVFAGLTNECGAQGVIYLNGSANSSSSPTASSGGLVFFNTTGTPVIDASTDINVELAYGTSMENVSLANAVTTLLLSSSQTQGNGSLGETLAAQGDIAAFGNGHLFDASGTAYQFSGIPAQTYVYFEVFAWTGNFSSYTAAQASGTALTGASGVFMEQLTALGATPSNIGNMPALVLTKSALPVPEPASVTLFGLGGLALLGVRGCR